MTYGILCRNRLYPTYYFIELRLTACQQNGQPKAQELFERGGTVDGPGEQRVGKSFFCKKSVFVAGQAMFF
jgi:hypothetical protein